jgi:hypothetical protein
LSIAGNPVQTQVIPPGGQDGQTITLNFNNLVSQNPDTDAITVDIYDAYGKELITGITPVNAVNQALPIGILYRDQ